MKKILISTDFSENSKNAMRYAMDLFQDIPCHFYLMFVNVQGLDYLQKPVYRFGTNILVENESKTVGQKLKDFDAYAKTISQKDHDHRFTTIQEKGYLLQSIRKHVEEKEIELIVMGTKGASKIKEFFMGSNTGDVITKVECDILVVPDKATYLGFNQVVFPTDFALPYSHDVLISISGVVTSKIFPIRLLHVTKSDDPLTREEQDHKDNLLQRLTESLPNPINFHTVRQKNVENAILDFAKNVKADLIIMVSKDHTFLHKQFLDTTVEEVSFDTGIPLLSIQG